MLNEVITAPAVSIAATSVQNLAKKLLADFRTRWLDDDTNQFDGAVRRGNGHRRCGIHPTVAIATALDPRTKKLGAFRNGTNSRENIWEALLHKMVQRTCPSENVVVAPHMVAAPLPPAPPVLAPPAAGKGNAEDIQFFMDRMNANEEDSEDDQDDNLDDMTTPLHDRCIAEVAAYKRLPKLPMKPGACPLEWWRLSSHQFPILSKLALMYLCIPATSAPSERILSMAVRLISSLRTNVSPRNAGMIVFINKNLPWFESLE